MYIFFIQQNALKHHNYLLFIQINFCFRLLKNSNSTKMNLTKTIVIVGAGISGLACAKRLKELGFQNVVILEARSRIGGRIYGLNFGMLSK